MYKSRKLALQSSAFVAGKDGAPGSEVLVLRHRQCTHGALEGLIQHGIWSLCHLRFLSAQRNAKCEDAR
jgi:hypothetical protein